MTGQVSVISESFASFGGSATGVFTKIGGFSGGGTPGGPDNNARGAFSMDASHTHNINNDGGTEVRVKNYALMYVIKF